MATTTVTYGNFYLQKRLACFTNSSNKWYISTSVNNSYIKNSSSGSAIADSNLSSFKDIAFTLPTIPSDAVVTLKGTFKQTSENSYTNANHKVTNNGKGIRYNGTSIGTISGDSQELSFDVTAAAKAHSGGTLTFEFFGAMATPTIGGLGSDAYQSAYCLTTYEITNLRLEIVVKESVVYYYNGSSWVPCIPYYYNGSTWVKCAAKYYNGSSWVDMYKV